MVFGSPYKGILTGKAGTFSFGVLDGINIVQAVTIGAGVTIIGTLSASYGMNVPMTYSYYMAHPKWDYANELWVEQGNNALFEIVAGVLQLKAAQGVGVYTAVVAVEDQDYWQHTASIVVTRT